MTGDDLRHRPVLDLGDGPARAAAEWRELGVARHLAPWDPVLVSSLASALHTPASDLDVVCDLRRPGFVAAATAAWGHRPGFAVHDDGPRVRVTFAGPRLPVELFGEARPVEEQAAHRHALVHLRLARRGGRALAEAVRGARAREGLKTEPAIARVLGLAGDPHAAVDALAEAGDAHLDALIRAALPTVGDTGERLPPVP